MKVSTINALRGMHSHHVGVYFKLYYLCQEHKLHEIYAENIAVHIASVFIPLQVSMRDAKVQQEALALDVALTALEKANLITYQEDHVLVHDLNKVKKVKEVVEIPKNEKLIGLLGGAWDEWMEYKKTNKPYKTPRTELIAYNQLMKACSNDEKIAADVVLNAISCQWMGLNPEICINRWEEAKKIVSKLAPQLQSIKDNHDKIGRINRQDLQEWIESK